MKLRLTLLALALIVASGAAWAQDAPEVDIPIYTGAEVGMEISVSNADILPMLKALMPLATGKLGEVAKNVTAEDIAAVLKDVTVIEMVQMEVTKPGTNESDVANFYAKTLPSGKWNRVFAQTLPGKSGTMAVYAQSGMTGLYGYRIETITVDGKPAKRATVAKIMGKIDFAKVMEIATKVMSPKPTTAAAK